MAIGDVLKGMRQNGYQKAEEAEGAPAQRAFPLTPEETQQLMPYQEKYQDEIVVEATGKIQDGMFHVTQVKYADGDGMKSELQEKPEMPAMRTMKAQYPN